MNRSCKLQGFCRISMAANYFVRCRTQPTNKSEQLVFVRMARKSLNCLNFHVEVDSNSSSIFCFHWDFFPSLLNSSTHSSFPLVSYKQQCVFWVFGQGFQMFNNRTPDEHPTS